MQVYLSCDMEGATGVVRFVQVTPGHAEYDFGRSMQRHDVLAVAETALQRGATRVVVNDAHDAMSNLDVRSFPKGIELVSGWPKVLCMVEAVEGCDVAFFVGYHAMAGTERGILDHTMSTSAIYDVKLNGRAVGETGINAALCGYLGIPVGLVTGDDAVCLEARSLLGDQVVTCAVKEGHGRFAGRVLSPETTGPMLREAAEEALARAKAGKLQPLRFEPPYRIEASFCFTEQCDAASLAPGSKRLCGRTIAGESDDLLQVYRWFMTALTAAESVHE